MSRSNLRGSALGIIALVGVSVVAVAAKPAPAVGGPVVPPNARTYGKDLNTWMGIYWAWYYGTGQNLGTLPTPGPFQPGPSPVVLMPMPGALDSTWTGSGTLEDPGTSTGTITVQLKSGTGFVLPSFAWIGERYQGYPGVPDDKMIPGDALRASVFDPVGGPGTVPDITLDGKPILRDYWANYVGPTWFESPIMYPVPSSYGSVAAIAYQGVGMVFTPLPPGIHVLRLHEELRLTPAQTGFALDVTYDNTWKITVVPGK